MSREIALRLLVYIALMGLLAATIALALAPLGAWRLPIALTIAGAKTLLVAFFFMELRRADLILRVVLASSLTLLIVLVVMSSLPG